MKRILFMIATSVSLSGLASTKREKALPAKPEFSYSVDKFADVEILRYRVPDFGDLSLSQKTLVYYLSEAALMGRDILFDQNGKYNLTIKRLLEAVYSNYNEKKDCKNYRLLEEYIKLVWFNNGIHYDYSSDKIQPLFAREFFKRQIMLLPKEKLPMMPGESRTNFIFRILPVMFNPAIMPKRVNQAEGEDLVMTSANNYYDGVTQAEAEAFYDKMKNPADQTPVSYGLNSRLVKENGVVTEKVWKVGGEYSAAIEKIVDLLKKALPYACNAQQKAVIQKLIDYYYSGNLKDFDDYAVLWVKDLESTVDFVNGFTESYGDPLGLKASWESIVNFKNVEATKRTKIISDNAQWFEDHSPVDARFKKEKVKGVSAKVITVAMLGGDCYPTTPIGINLPNSNWIRRDHGSKSVTIENITEAYDKAAQGNGFFEEFVPDATERERLKAFGFTADNLHTDLHECLGHGSGKLLPGVDPDALKAYGSPIEEARADLYALYFMGDAKTVDLGLLPDKEAYKAEYYKYVLNGYMTQLTRIKPGKNIEQAHMRNRALIARWVVEQGAAEKVVEIINTEGKTQIRVNDYVKMRELIGRLLAEIQRIKSEGDYEAARQMIEKYAVKVDPELHKEVLARYAKLNIAPFRGFVNPVMTAIRDKEGQIIDIKIEYREGYAEQMMRYARKYSTLPIRN